MKKSIFLLILIIANIGCHCPKSSINKTQKTFKSKWSDSINGLQFRVITKQRVICSGEKLEINVEIRNSGKKDVAIINPQKLSQGQCYVLFTPYRYVNGKVYYCERYKLEPGWIPEYYSILSPGQQISGTFYAPYELLSLPVGKHSIYLSSPETIIDKYSTAIELWTQEDLKRIVPKLWKTGNIKFEIGPIEIEVIDTDDKDN